MSFPIILCGKSTEIAQSVKKGLEPEVEGAPSEVPTLLLSLTLFESFT